MPTHQPFAAIGSKTDAERLTLVLGEKLNFPSITGAALERNKTTKLNGKIMDYETFKQTVTSHLGEANTRVEETWKRDDVQVGVYEATSLDWKPNQKGQGWSCKYSDTYRESWLYMEYPFGRESSELDDAIRQVREVKARKGQNSP